MIEQESSTSKRPIEEQEQIFLAFVQQHHAELVKWYKILYVLCFSSFSYVTYKSINPFVSQEVFETSPLSSHSKPIKLLVDTIERVLPQEIIVAENESIRKILGVLVFLCDEVYQLRDIAEGR